MSAPLFIEGVALWAPAWPGWAPARDALRGDAATGAVPADARPAAGLLGANERRRAPLSVLVATSVAQDAVAMSGRDASALASVFASAHGDLAIVDALCRTLAADPLLLSPTRFHHSVHNAASGYWAMASGSRAASSAVSGWQHSFALGLLEAATQCAADERPVLLVGFDTEAQGPLVSVNRSRGLLGVALVLAPRRAAAARWRIDWALSEGGPPPAGPPSTAAVAAVATAGLDANAMADALPLFEALASGRETTRHLSLGPGTDSAPAMGLSLRIHPLDGP